MLIADCLSSSVTAGVILGDDYPGAAAILANKGDPLSPPIVTAYYPGITLHTITKGGNLVVALDNSLGVNNDNLGSVGLFAPLDTNADGRVVYSPVSRAGFPQTNYASINTSGSPDSQADGVWAGAFQPNYALTRGLRITFDTLLSGLENILDVSVYLIRLGSAEPHVQIEAFTSGGVSLGTNSIILTNNGEFTLNVSTATPIGYVEVFGLPNQDPAQNEQRPYYITGFGFNEEEFSEIPEPATLISWSILGLCGMAGHLRRRRRLSLAA